MRVVGLGVALLLGCAVAGSAGAAASAPDLAAWHQFVDVLRSQPFPTERVRPYEESLREPLLGFLEVMRERANWEEWTKDPEVFRIDDRIHFLLPLTFDGQASTYCLSFIMEEGKWYFQHLEAIFLRLDALGALPVSGFPDLPEPTKAWMRAEIEVSRDVWLYNTLAAEKGRVAALNWFRDGAGYALAARSWVPFVSPEQAFVLYACWEQANLRGNALVLETLADNEAVIRFTPMFLLLYKKTAHLRQQIAYEDYVDLFEFRWRDRAASAGWDVEFHYDASECVMRFHRILEVGKSRPTSN
ncbi:hypothetical protein ACFL4G_02555 [Thermodesulfobacteriota bacterium]